MDRYSKIGIIMIGQCDIYYFIPQRIALTTQNRPYTKIVEVSNVRKIRVDMDLRHPLYSNELSCCWKALSVKLS